ncbi:MAG: DUF115 domain-containing protein [Verrucomicrobia bacterium]|nr:DUF115 domain-containing protein [Verrucomicrobiota bacterium]
MSVEIPDADWICSIGIRPELFEKLRPWLDEETKRRLVFIDIEGEGGSFDHPQAQVYPGSTHGELLESARKLGWKSVFCTAAVIDPLNLAPQFEKALNECREAAHLLLSDWADGGGSVLKHAFSHWNSIPDVRSALALKDKFQNVPAIICGGGPSLKKNRHLLDREKALIFAGGAALDQIGVEPHFAASIDREAPPLKTFWQAPFLYQSRMNPVNFSLLHGEKLYVPDGCYPAEVWLSGTDLFDGGWTVGTFLTSLALHFGCDPIIFVGMDFCYENEKKYALLEHESEREMLVEAVSSSGMKVMTQRDWLMAAKWISDLATKRWDRTFINATEGGLGFSKVKETSLQEALAGLKGGADLAGWVHAETVSLNYMQVPLDKMRLWKKSLRRCLKLCEKGMKKPANFDGEIVYQKLLFPLWQIWRPLFERELEVDSQPIPIEEKIRLNQMLFFQQVLNEQAN